MKFCPIFHFFLSNLNKILYWKVHKNLLSDVGFMKSAQWKLYLTERPKWVSVSTFHVYFPFWVKLYKRSTQNHVEYLRVWCKSAWGKTILFNGYKLKYIYACTMLLYVLWKVNNALVRPVLHCRIHNWQSCLFTHKVQISVKHNSPFILFFFIFNTFKALNV